MSVLIGTWKAGIMNYTCASAALTSQTVCTVEKVCSLAAGHLSMVRLTTLRPLITGVPISLGNTAAADI